MNSRLKYSLTSSFSFLLALSAGSLGLAYAPSASAATYYVRTDGGTAAQCNGTANTAYSAGVAPACAWSSPNYALPLGKETTTAQRLKGGDTLNIGPGTYNVGAGTPTSEGCFANAPYDCFSKPIPSGTAALKTRITGASASGTCSAAPKLVGVGADLYAVLNLEGSSNVDISCLEITDASQCIKAHNHFGTARGVTARCGTSDKYAQYGIVSRNSSNVNLTNLNIHGLAVNGIRAGKLSNWTMDGVKIVANGWAGWDGDIAPGDQTASSNSGNIIFKNSEIAWNGCGERLDAALTKFGCWAQENGGYGDGLGTGRTGGNWLFENVNFHHNTSDGLDMLYMNGTGTVTVRRVRAQGNAGNQIKVAGTSLIENSLAISNCAFFATFPTSNLTGGENCRAMGNALSVNMIDGSQATIRHNTVTGEGDCQLITVGGNTSARVFVQNNVFLGDTEWQSRSYGAELSCGHYAESSVAPVVFQNNLFWNVKNGQCPSGSICGRDPKLTRTTYENYDATPLAGSPLIDAALSITAVVVDYFGRARVYGPKSDIGAIEVQPASGGGGGGRVTGGVLPPQLSNGTNSGATAAALGSQAVAVPASTPAATDGSTATAWRSRGSIFFDRATLAAYRFFGMARSGFGSMFREAREWIDDLRSEQQSQPNRTASAAAVSGASALARWSTFPFQRLVLPMVVSEPSESPARAVAGSAARSAAEPSARQSEERSERTQARR